MGIWGDILDVGMGAGSGFLAGGPAGAVVGGGMALAGKAAGGGGGGGFMPGSGGFKLQNDATTNQMNLSNSLMNMGQEQFSQESPYRSNMLNALQERATAPMPVYAPRAPTHYNPYQNTYRVAPTHGPASAPRGHQGFSGGPAYQQASAPPAPQASEWGQLSSMSAIPKAGEGGSMPVGAELDRHYEQQATGGAFNTSNDPSGVSYDSGNMAGSYGEWDTGPHGETQTVSDTGGVYRGDWDPETGGMYRLVDDGSGTDDLYARTDREGTGEHSWAQAGANTQQMSEEDAQYISHGGAVLGPGGMPLNTGGLDGMGYTDPQELRRPDPYATDKSEMTNAPREIVENATSVSDPAIADALRQATSVDAATQLRETGLVQELIPMGGDYFIIRSTDADGNVVSEVPFGKDG